LNLQVVLEGPYPPGAGITQLERPPISIWVARLQGSFFERNFYVAGHRYKDAQRPHKA